VLYVNAGLFVMPPRLSFLFVKFIRWKNIIPIKMKINSTNRLINPLKESFCWGLLSSLSCALQEASGDHLSMVDKFYNEELLLAGLRSRIQKE
jgi:hypothetical protein